MFAVPQVAGAVEVRVATAANFAAPAREIGALFSKVTGHRALFSFGSTGQLYAQIAHGAPFDVFLAADQIRPRKAIAAGHAVPGSRFTYAIGRIVLFSTRNGLVMGPSTLKQASFIKIAIANPTTSPYGAAAVQAMTALGVFARLSAKVVQGNNVAQTFQFVKTGNAEIGFVALSQVARSDDGSRWVVPANLHAPIAQDAVLLKRGAANAGALAFLAFLKGPRAHAITAKYGYGAGE